MMSTEQTKTPARSYCSYSEYLNHFYGEQNEQADNAKLEKFFGGKLLQRVLEIEVAERFHTTSAEEEQAGRAS